MKKFLIIIILLCTILLLNFLGYSQFKTTSFKEMASEENWAKIIIVEGYTYLVRDFVPAMVENSVKYLIYDTVSQDSYILLDFSESNIKYMPLGRGIFKTRVKGMVVIRDANLDIITIDVINYGLALQEKIYLKTR